MPVAKTNKLAFTRSQIIISNLSTGIIESHKKNETPRAGSENIFHLQPEY